MRPTHLQWVHGTGIIASREVVTRRLLAEIQYQVAVLPTAGPARMSDHARGPLPLNRACIKLAGPLLFFMVNALTALPGQLRALPDWSASPSQLTIANRMSI
jgi:hypothetical protein